MAAGLVTASPAANATFAGRNGFLVVTHGNCDDYDCADLPSAISPAGRDLGRPPLPDAASIAFAPGGHRFAVDGIATGTVGSAKVRRLTRPGRLHDLSPSWSPDGRRIAFCRGTAEPGSDEPAVGNLYVVAVARPAEARRVTGLGTCSAATWSVRGLIAFAAGAPRSGSIYVVRPDGNGLRRVGRGGDNSQPDWSPDGRRLAYTCATPPSPGIGELRDVCVTDLGRRVHRLTDSGTARGPIWSPDGRRVAYSGDGAVWIAHANGSHATKVYDPGEDVVTLLAWQPAPS